MEQSSFTFGQFLTLATGSFQVLRRFNFGQLKLALLMRESIQTAACPKSSAQLNPRILGLPAWATC